MALILGLYRGLRSRCQPHNAITAVENWDNQACSEKYLFSARKKSYKVLRYFSFLRPEDLNKYTHLAVRKFLCKTQSASVLSFPQSHWELQTTVCLLLCVNFYYFSMSTSLISSTIPSQSVYLISKAISWKCFDAAFMVKPNLNHVLQFTKKGEMVACFGPKQCCM